MLQIDISAMTNNFNKNASPQISNLPKILYKYRYFDKKGYHLRLIESALLWFTSAHEFNDPFDSTLQFKFEDNPAGIKKKWAMGFVRKEYPHLNNKERRILVRERLREMRKDPQHLDWFKETFTERIYNSLGMCCLTPHKDNLLMWAHYSFNHQGFCVGFNTTKLNNFRQSLALDDKVIELLKVSYSGIMPNINFYKSCLSDIWHDDIMILLCTKSKDWEYEHEYRLIYWDHTDTSVSFDHDIIDEIILGCRISVENKDKVTSIIKNMNYPIKLYQALKHETKFELEFDEIILS